jgi:DNA (cytosine-5)-methyltransferase 1
MLEAVMIKQATKVGSIKWQVGGVADLSFPTSKTRRGRVQEGGTVSPTIMSSNQELYKLERNEMESYRIRRLTPLECWRLMGFSDEDFKAAEENKLNSDTQLYAQAGNSIVVNVLEAIFGEMLPKDKTTKEEPEENQNRREEQVDAVKQKIYELTETELKAANEKFPLFASSHEAYGVIFEEFDETRDELESLEYSIDQFWSDVKENSSEDVKNNRLTRIYEKSIDLAVEAIQTAAMARKGILSSYQKGDPAYGETTEN